MIKKLKMVKMVWLGQLDKLTDTH